MQKAFMRMMLWHVASGIGNKIISKRMVVEPLDDPFRQCSGTFYENLLHARTAKHQQVLACPIL